MNKLSYLEKLLDGVEVEWKTLEKVLKRTKGTKITAGQMKALHKDNAPLKIFAGGKTVAFVDFKDIPEKDINREPSIIVKSRGIIEFEYYDKPFSHKNEMWSYHSNNDAISIKYIYYFLKTNEGYFQKIGGKMQMPQIATPDTDKFEVPIPCPDNPEKSLAIQSEIVRILDKFTALTAALTAELTMRKKQYNYYHDQLMNLEEREDTREMSIGDIYDFQYGTGNTIPKSGGQYPVYGSNGIVGSHDKYNSEDSPVIGHIGAYAGIVNWGQGKHFVTYNGVICRHKSKEVLQKYAYHLLLLQDFGSKSNSASQPFVSYNILNAPIVLVPPLQEQARIVAILDKFDTLTSSITEGLPREIELRQKQYEYYRDLLFSFPTSEAASN
ncbi:restriction endonuclease subunit S [Klebsiella pneumoniae]|uniref:restriction endonuclease subunit S n=1 Tax=Klebsiella pneumoniae TaxID=573 RepID=UPI0007CA019D|nr:restriction endonuclease subunit S [Klebsiella pneumoniae]EKX3213317.1 restriction endonuclease subunit S [Klebsiella pneumoniae]EKX3428057.1 restriction endonuclease subunit S [Klebsiella pneumoniae]MDG5159187.1 restriction endonuclease subunit S [Klebsiella pneumoniae]QVQ94709.1 restriction endonuclease subunit S [Klebsiella pneumoniae]SAS67142.1 Restriction modification system DNA specificity domain protein [Klebsiella pneumoniae]